MAVFFSFLIALFGGGPGALDTPGGPIVQAAPHAVAVTFNVDAPLTG